MARIENHKYTRAVDGPGAGRLENDANRSVSSEHTDIRQVFCKLRQGLDLALLRACDRQRLPAFRDDVCLEGGAWGIAARR